MTLTHNHFRADRLPAAPTSSRGKAQAWHHEVPDLLALLSEPDPVVRQSSMG